MIQLHVNEHRTLFCNDNYNTEIIDLSFVSRKFQKWVTKQKKCFASFARQIILSHTSEIVAPPTTSTYQTLPRFE